MSESWLLFFVFLPIAGAALMPVAERIAKALTDVLAVAVMAALLAAGLAIAGWVRVSGPMSFVLPGALPFAQTLYLDSLSLLLLLVVNGVALLALIFSIEYMKSYGPRQGSTPCSSCL